MVGLTISGSAAFASVTLEATFVTSACQTGSATTAKRQKMTSARESFISLPIECVFIKNQWAWRRLLVEVDF